MNVRERPSRTSRAARAARVTFRSKIAPPAGRAPWSAPRGPLRKTGADSTLIRPFSPRRGGRSYIRVKFVFRAQISALITAASQGVRPNAPAGGYASSSDRKWGGDAAPASPVPVGGRVEGRTTVHQLKGKLGLGGWSISGEPCASVLGRQRRALCTMAKSSSRAFRRGADRHLAPSTRRVISLERGCLQGPAAAVITPPWPVASSGY